MSDANANPEGAQDAFAIMAQWSRYFDDKIDSDELEESVDLLLENADDEHLISVINCLSAFAVDRTHNSLDAADTDHEEYFTGAVLNNLSN